MIINFKYQVQEHRQINTANNCYNQLIEFDTQKSPSISQLMQIPSQKQPDMQISKSSTKIGTTLSGSLNMRCLPITIKKVQQVITPKPEQLTNQYFNSVLNEPQNSNQPIISIFKAFDNESRKILQKYCILQFDNLSLFLLYQLGWELGLQELNNVCAEELINLNYEQLNYSKFDLMKCSFYTFRKILDQYNSSIKFLDIQGLKPADLKSTIDDYCMMNNIEQKEKQNLYNQYIYNKENTLMKPIQKNQATRRSMVQSTKTKIQAATPLKTKNTLNLARTPTLALDEFNEPGENFKHRAKQIEYSKKLSLSESVNIMKAIAEEQNAKESQLYENMLSMRKQVENTKNENFLQESFDKLEKILESMQKQLQSQDEKIKKIQKSASDIKAGTTGTKKIDFVFSF